MLRSVDLKTHSQMDLIIGKWFKQKSQPHMFKCKWVIFYAPLIDTRNNLPRLHITKEV
jgi:hypothetical protein